MNLKILLRIGIFLLFSFLMIFDYFPHIIFNDSPKTALTIGMISLAIIYIVINQKTEKNCETNSLIGESAFIFYMLVLIGALTLLGGGIHCRNLLEKSYFMVCFIINHSRYDCKI
ncbi:hypothetical protein [Peribacillus sp. NPDC060253]|uniref:hypothetical protein n=1 Tax=Peribacillus sp. NPDC060253 TaxID=3347084 RepID=UPI003663F87C